MPHVETDRERTTQRARLDLTSPAFHDGARIPSRHSSEGADVSPPLRWSDPPAATKSFALICEDPDAPSGTFVHWLAWNIKADQRELGEDVQQTADTYEIRHG